MEIASLSHQAEQQQSTLTKQVPFEKSRATKPLLTTTPALGHNPRCLVAEVQHCSECSIHVPHSATRPPPLWAPWCQTAVTCVTSAISSSSHISKGPKSGMSLSIPHWSQRRCTFPYRCTDALLVMLSKWNKCILTAMLKSAPGHVFVYSPLDFVSFVFFLFFFWNHLPKSDKNEILFCSWIVVYWSNN